ncbi:hypothetical protein [Paludibaculum fermentans]|uniref:Uncharacterized protein n=1 Tax=Paludibaculum fermentans TaxID=1473598 RepID=A0A7S7NPQ2_PALFE|nr:hypothetical protein [Paludibaculum fermentans]QOY87493.1 hypothetical protein IRI77_32855 [Paludibaculum fermentans]
MDSKDTKYEINDQKPGKQPEWRQWLLPAAVAVLLGTTVWSMLALTNERDHTAQLLKGNQELSASVSTIQGQMQSMADRIYALNNKLQTVEQSAQPKPAEPDAGTAAAPAVPKPRKRAAVRTGPPKPVIANDPRVDQLQARLTDQQRELENAKAQIEGARTDIAGTRSDLGKTREDLEGRLNATRDDLGNTIARNHDEVVELQKRGQRNYYEFQITKAKTFQKVGPLSLSLRKANNKKNSFDLTMLVDDRQLQKRNINMYEPVMISLPDHIQPVELVINQVTKDQIKGYLSEPKYRKSEMASSDGPSSPKAPALQQRPQ